MSVNWNDQSLKHVLVFQQISPTNLNKVLGTLRNVILSESSITAGYYTDARVQATIVCHDSNWVRGAFIRITDTVPEKNWSRVLGTFVVTNDDATITNGVWKTTYTCYSLIWTLSKDYRSSALQISKNGSSRTALKSICKTSGRPYRDTASDVKYKAMKVYPVGTTQLERIFDICDATKRRLDVDPDGTLRTDKRTSLGKKTPLYTLDYSAGNTIMHDDFSRSSNLLELPDASVAYYSWTEQTKQKTKNKSGKTVEKTVNTKKELSTEATRVISTEAGKRPFRIALYNQVANTDHNKQEYTKESLKKKAKSYLTASYERIKWKGTIQYLPIWEGDVLRIVLPDKYGKYAGNQKVYVQEMTLNLDTMQIQVTLRSTASGDEND